MPMPKLIHKYLKSNAREYDVNKEGNNSCSICLESLDKKGQDGKAIPVVELNCSKKHIFHLNCLKKRSKVKFTCPICRESILPQKNKNRVISQS